MEGEKSAENDKVMLGGDLKVAEKAERVWERNKVIEKTEEIMEENRENDIVGNIENDMEENKENDMEVVHSGKLPEVRTSPTGTHKTQVLSRHSLYHC